MYVTTDGIAQFFHYSWDAFRELAHDKVFSITNVPGAKQALKGLRGTDSGQADNSASVTTDSTGFPVRKPPFLQMERGEIDLANIIRTAHVADILPRSGEPTVVETEPGKFSLVRRGAVDRTIRRESKREESPMQWRQSISMEPSRTLEGTPTPSNQSVLREPPNIIQKPPSALNQSNKPPKELILGRPRKYMRGTEKFWQRIFKQARLDANGIGSRRESRVGMMKDPAGLALYASRPKEFDETLLQAIDAHLPVPSQPQEINEDWIQRIKEILGRSTDGVFVSPKGLLSGSVRQQSQILIFKSSRLKDVDFVDRNIVHPYSFLSSSASHSFAYRRFYPVTSGRESGTGNGQSISRIGRQNTAKQKPGLRKEVFDEGQQEVEPQTQLPSLPGDLPEDTVVRHPDVTTNEEVQAEQSRHETILTSSFGPSTTGMHEGEETNRVGKTSQEIILPPGPVATVNAPTRTRPSRNRKLTTKAKDNLIRPRISIDSSPAEISSAEMNPPLLGSDQGHLVREESTPPVDPGGEAVPSIPTAPTALPSNHDDAPAMANTTLPSKLIEDLSKYASPTFPDASSLDVSEKHGTAPREGPIDGIPPMNIPETNEIVTLETSEPEIELPATRRSAQHKRKRRQSSAAEGTDSEDEDRSPRKRQKETTQKYTAGSINLCQKIVLHLLSETEGAVPNDAFTLRRIASPLWKEAGFGESPLRKTVYQAVKYLCQRGKLKQTMFSFRGKSGVMVQRSIIYLPTIRSSSDLVQEIKRKVIEAEPADYIPPEWADRGTQKPLFADKDRLSDVVGNNSRRRQTSLTRPEGSAEARSARSSRSSTRSPSPLTRATPAGPAMGFITLKIPILSGLPSVQLENWRSELARAIDLASATAFAKTRQRSTRSSGLLGRDRPIKWANKDAPDFPTSLLDILLVTPAKQLQQSVDVDDRNRHRFATEIEAIETWEQKRRTAAQNFRTRYGFINHSIPAVLLHDAIEPLNIEFSKLTNFDESGTEVEIPFPESESWSLLALALTEKDVDKMAIIAEWSRGTLNHTLVPSEDEDGRQLRPRLKRKIPDDDGEFSPPTKRRRKGWKQAKMARRAKAIGTRNLHTGSSHFTRGVQYLRDLSLQQVHRLALSVIVVRTLAGGLEGFIDWPIVMTLFPGESEEVIQGRWKTLSAKYRGDIQGLTSSLQVKYLDALEADQVPCVNFADLHATDWHGIVEWASDSLDRFNPERIDALPADRASFMEANEFSFVEPRGVHNLLTYGNQIPSTVREEVMGSTIFGSTQSTPEGATRSGLILAYKPTFEAEISDAALRLAKSWVFASILTPDPGFDQELVRAKLAGLASTPNATDDLLYRALGVLQDEKLIQKTSNSQKLVLSRGIWEPAKKLYERFEERRMITAGMLRQAVLYKLEVLDPAFARGELVTIQKTGIVEDGAMVTILNLMADGLVRARSGSDVPRTRYGLDWENIGYKTREMDKRLLEFNVDLMQMEDYTFGDKKQVGRSILIPRGDADTPMGHIPPWLDIHGRFQSSLWEMFVAGVLGLIVQLPGIGARDISRTLGFALDEGEVGLLMNWCVEAGFATIEPRTGGYETTRDWWLCISTGKWAWNDSKQ